MTVLLIAMPDTISSLDQIMRIPNLGLSSIAGNLENCDVYIIDLVMHKKNIAAFLRKTMAVYKPDLVGLSAMSFQYASAVKAAEIIKEYDPALPVVLGGYHATLMYEEIAEHERVPFDFLVRGEGELAFNALAARISAGERDFNGIPGVSYKRSGRFTHNEPSPLIDLAGLKLPKRDIRIFNKGTFMRLKFDCAETSRGCSMGCNFCSITKMYGRTCRVYKIDRVIEDLRNAKERGAQGLFFVDDNITLNIPRLKELCRRIADEGLNSMYYAIQASVPGIASDRELAGLMKAAGFRWVFLGIESGSERDLADMNKKGIFENTRRAVTFLREQGICVLGGFIAGYPQDTKEDIKALYDYAFEIGVDHAIVQCLTPYPKTEIREQLSARGLITNAEDWSAYNGFRVNIRTEHLSSEELNKWIILFGIRLYFNPAYILRSRVWWYQPGNAPQMLLNNFIFIIDGLRGRLFQSRHTW